MGDGKGQTTSERILGYCTNVHAGATLIEMIGNLAACSTSVRARYCPDRELPIGMWFMADVLQSIHQNRQGMDLIEFLWDHQLAPFTINGFPFGCFHDPVVKHQVYHPNWLDDRRVEYSKNLPRPLRGVEMPGGELSISTLPIGWKHDIATSIVSVAVGNLWECVRSLARLSVDDVAVIHLDLEPEPGCFLETSSDVVSFFEQFVFELHAGDAFIEDSTPIFRKHLRICHDICHAAVMFEDQREMLKRYDDAGIKIGKVQVSNAIRVDFDALSPPEKLEALAQLKSFEEDRYPHQTCIRDNATGAITFHEDLPLATAAAEQAGEPVGEWRVHFHVPVYLESFGLLGTTRDYIDDLLDLMPAHPEIHHFEVETYAWDVLPDELKRESLAEGIADELIWTRARMQNRSLLDPNQSG